MKKVVGVVLMLLFVAGMVYARDYEVTKKAGEYMVEVKIDKNPPVVGDNGMKIEIKDASGKYVLDAKVVVDYAMPGMPGMPAMNYKTDAEGKGHSYSANMNLSMSGSWNVAVKITKAGKTSTLRFTVDAK